jgi:hypothetical protein
MRSTAHRCFARDTAMISGLRCEESFRGALIPGAAGVTYSICGGVHLATRRAPRPLRSSALRR